MCTYHPHGCQFGCICWVQETPGPPSEAVGQSDVWPWWGGGAEGSSPPWQHCHCLLPPEVTPCTLPAHTVHSRTSVESHSCHLALVYYALDASLKTVQMMLCQPEDLECSGSTSSQEESQGGSLRRQSHHSFLKGGPGTWWEPIVYPRLSP